MVFMRVQTESARRIPKQPAAADVAKLHARLTPALHVQISEYLCGPDAREVLNDTLAELAIMARHRPDELPETRAALIAGRRIVDRLRVRMAQLEP